MGYLTKDNLDQIRIYLGKTGVKDSQFEELNTLTGLEYITLVSDTGNKKIRISALKTIFTGEGDVALERVNDLVTTVTEMATATKNTVDNNWTKQW